MDPWPKRLARLRYAVGMSQAKVAKALGIAPPSVAQWETGRSRPGIDRLPQLATLYNVSLEELCGADFPLVAAERAAERAELDAFYGPDTDLPVPEAFKFAKDADEAALLGFWRGFNKPNQKMLLHFLASGFDTSGTI